MQRHYPWWQIVVLMSLWWRSRPRWQFRVIFVVVLTDAAWANCSLFFGIRWRICICIQILSGITGTLCNHSSLPLRLKQDFNISGMNCSFVSIYSTRSHKRSDIVSIIMCPLHVLLTPQELLFEIIPYTLWMIMYTLWCTCIHYDFGREAPYIFAYRSHSHIIRSPNLGLISKDCCPLATTIFLSLI